MRVLKNSANMRGVWHLEWSEYDNFVHMLVPLGLKKNPIILFTFWTKSSNIRFGFHINYLQKSISVLGG